MTKFCVVWIAKYEIEKYHGYLSEETKHPLPEAEIDIEYKDRFNRFEAACRKYCVNWITKFEIENKYGHLSENEILEKYEKAKSLEFKMLDLDFRDYPHDETRAIQIVKVLKKIEENLSRK
uniref:Uncharacterized protein n=1 Tax=Ditylenchus dipsaci TaxID=166011 RepID=A0A915EKH3_9BILA